MANSGKFDTPQHETSKIDVLAEHGFASFEAGSILLDRYEVIGLLGKGGMGSVFHIKHLHLQSEFALKVLNRQADKALWRRFENEARAASRLDHPNLIKVYDSGLLPDGQPYFVMELVKGQTLSDLLAKHGRLPLRKALKIFIQVGFALAYAHENGVIHRDLKPSNIMLTRGLDGSLTSAVKVVDLGIAKLTGVEEFNQQTLTRTGEIFGSPLYMSPEQCKGIAVDSRADLYSLGCSLYEALTGAPPFIGENALSTMMKHQMEKALSLKEASMGDEFPQEIDILIAKLLEKEPCNRYSSAQFLTAELVKIERELDENECQNSFAMKSSAPIKANTASQFSFLKTHGITLCLMLLCYLLGLGTNVLRNPVQYAAPVVKQETSSPLFPDGKSKHTVPEPIEEQPEYFSTLSNDKKLRIFKFPKGKSIGELVTDDGVRQAIGEVQLPVSKFFVFRPAPKYLDSTKLLKRFRVEELKGLELKDLARSTLDALAILPHFRNLEALTISMDLDDTAIEYIGQLPKLKMLDVSNTDMTGKGIASLKTFPNLTMLGCSGLKNMTPLIRRLPEAHLKELRIESVNLTPADVRKIGQMKSLEILGIGGNSAIDDDAIKELKPLQNLKSLFVSDCPLTRKSFATLASLKPLVNLQVSEGMFSDDEIRELRKQLKASVEVRNRPIR